MSEPSGLPGNLQNLERRYERLYGDELFERIRDRPLAWLPLGILEHHGGHLPWGLDGLKAHAVCLRMASKLGGIILPATHLAGIHGDCADPGGDAEFRWNHARIGDLLYSESTFRLFLDETFDGLANMGFRVVVAYTGHYPEIQTQVLREAAAAITATGRAVAIPFWEPLACGGGDHGGKWETSIYLALSPDEVRLDSIGEDGTGEPGLYRGQDVRANASAALGEEALATIETFLTT